MAPALRRSGKEIPRRADSANVSKSQALDIATLLEDARGIQDDYAYYAFVNVLFVLRGGSWN